MHHAPEDVGEPPGALAARRALAAALVAVELRQAPRRAHDAAGVVHHDAPAAAEERAHAAQGLVVERHVERVDADHGHRRSAGPHGLHLAAGAQAAGHVVDELAQGGLAQHHLEVARVQHMTRYREQLGARALLVAHGGVPVGPAVHDGRQRRQGLHVVDERGAAIQPGHGRERRLEARLAALALEALEQRGLLAADIGTGTAVHRDVERPARPEGVGAQPSRGAGLGDGVVQHPGLGLVLAADVDVRALAPHGVRGDGDALDQLEGVVLDDLPVLEGAGLALVGVAHHVGGLAGVLGQERRLAAHGESGAAAAAKARAVEGVEGVVGAEGQGLLEAQVATGALVVGERGEAVTELAVAVHGVELGH